MGRKKRNASAVQPGGMPPPPQHLGGYPGMPPPMGMMPPGMPPHGMPPPPGGHMGGMGGLPPPQFGMPPPPPGGHMGGMMAPVGHHPPGPPPMGMPPPPGSNPYAAPPSAPVGGGNKRARTDIDDVAPNGERQVYPVKKYRPDSYYKSIEAFAKYTKSHRMLDAAYVKWNTSGATPEKPIV